MATLTKHTLSHGQSGRGITLAGGSAAAAHALHGSGTGMANFDEVYIYGTNNSSTAIDVSLIWGLSASDDLSKAALGNADTQVVTFNPKIRTTLVNGRVLQNGLSACAYADTANEIVIDGYVNRIVA